MFYYLCITYEVESDKINKTNIRNVDDIIIIDEFSAYFVKVSMNDYNFIITNINCVTIYVCCISITIYQHVQLSNDKLCSTLVDDENKFIIICSCVFME